MSYYWPASFASLSTKLLFLLMTLTSNLPSSLAYCYYYYFCKTEELPSAWLLLLWFGEELNLDLLLLLLLLRMMLLLLALVCKEFIEASFILPIEDRTFLNAPLSLLPLLYWLLCRKSSLSSSWIWWISVFCCCYCCSSLFWCWILGREFFLLKLELLPLPKPYYYFYYYYYYYYCSYCCCYCCCWAWIWAWICAC